MTELFDLVIILLKTALDPILPFMTKNNLKNKNAIILPPSEKAPLHTSNIFCWMWYFLLPYKKTILFFLSYRTLRYTFLSLLPLMSGYIIDGLESGDAFNNPQHYYWLISGFMLVFIILLFNMVFVPEIAAFEKAARGLTLLGIRHLNKLSLNWHEKEGSGGKLQRVMTGRRGFQEFTRMIRWDVFPLIGNIFAIGITIVIGNLPPLYFLLFSGFVVSYLFCSWYFARPYFGLYNKFNEKFENLLSGVYEFVSAIRTVKAFHLGGYIGEKASRLEEVGQEAIMDAFTTNLLRWTICNMLAGVWLLIFLGVGFYWTLQETMTIGAYSATLLLAIYIWSSCEVLGAILEKFYEYGNGIHRLVKTLRITPKQLDLMPEQNFSENWKTISLKNVSFRYNDNETQGLHDISFTVTRGEKIAFVGYSGAGKSTLVKLLMKQMLPDSGEFTIDNVSIPHVSTEKWLSQIGFVPQDVELFNLSIRENILIDRDDFEPELLNKVLKQAALDEFIDTLPQGLDTVIGERGIKLSGGQRQRLGIARALVRQAPIMIFDEATSSLDSIAESKIQNAIENSFEDRTVFVIAHRLSTIRNVDRIIVLDKGKIIEDGSFNNLLNKRDHFAKLWAIQSEEKSTETSEL